MKAKQLIPYAMIASFTRHTHSNMIKNAAIAMFFLSGRILGLTKIKTSTLADIVSNTAANISNTTNATTIILPRCSFHIGMKRFIKLPFSQSADGKRISVYHKDVETVNKFDISQID